MKMAICMGASVTMRPGNVDLDDDAEQADHDQHDIAAAQQHDADRADERDVEIHPIVGHEIGQEAIEPAHMVSTK